MRAGERRGGRGWKQEGNSGNPIQGLRVSGRKNGTQGPWRSGREERPTDVPYAPECRQKPQRKLRKGQHTIQADTSTAVSSRTEVKQSSDWKLKMWKKTKDIWRTRQLQSDLGGTKRRMRVDPSKHQREAVRESAVKYWSAISFHCNMGG